MGDGRSNLAKNDKLTAIKGLIKASELVNVPDNHPSKSRREILTVEWKPRYF